ncbi:short-chain dehydrogenase [Mycolicibacterium murale]|jgi:3-oxoacyl-[acyl-carrier protein] reductase|uniref:3-oxoacyl-[acyl-carrier-protein] reductase MabA n=1 Tax=Mycolicibacterium murale TaxID=182220 RepID=A0A7I9WFQ5_9MYCO|nr:SDR family oxidoreductase [Mycolicibacterium murale]GFG56581.1 short-chain dehydrogenase [Mycolicibacterium murale]
MARDEVTSLKPARTDTGHSAETAAATPDVGGSTQRRVALITGATRGIGAATALLLGRRGYRVAVHHDRSAAEADHIASRIADYGGDALTVSADLAVPDEVSAMVETIARRWDAVEVLVHAARLPHVRGAFSELRLDQLEHAVAQELRAAYLVTKAVNPAMTARGYGRLVYLSTAHSRSPAGLRIIEGTAQAALDQFVRHIAQELAPHGITANVVAPGNVAGIDAHGAKWSDDELWVLGTANTEARPVLPGDVARTIAFFAGDDCVTTTGHRAAVDTGLAAR